jgi:RNA polymerase sigma-70 factor (ECF subfamily)
MSTLEFNTLVGNHSQTLRGYAIQYTKNWDDAEDLIQDTLLKALRLQEKKTSNEPFGKCKI